MEFCCNAYRIAFFRVAYLIEKSRAKEIEDEEESTKVLKSAQIIFYIWTNASIILSILIMLSVLCVEWHLALVAGYIIYQMLDVFVYLVRVIRKQMNKHLFFRKLAVLLLMLGLVVGLYAYQTNSYMQDLKPVIYIYIYTPKETTVQVSVGHPEKLSCAYPEYDEEKGWEVIAKPNGDLVDTKTGRNLYCL